MYHWNSFVPCILVLKSHMNLLIVLLNQHSHRLKSTKSCDHMIFYYIYQPITSSNTPLLSSVNMRSLSAAQTNHILSLLDSGHSAHQISSSTDFGLGTISRLRSKHRSSLQKSLGGRPSKLSPANTRHAIHLIRTGKAENAAQVTKPLQDIINKPLSTKTVH